MTARKPRPIISPDALQRACDELGNAVIVSPTKFANELDMSVKTLYQWIEQGRLDGSFRKRGKKIFILRKEALNILFNGPDWSNS